MQAPPADTPPLEVPIPPRLEPAAGGRTSLPARLGDVRPRRGGWGAALLVAVLVFAGIVAYLAYRYQVTSWERAVAVADSLIAGTPPAGAGLQFLNVKHTRQQVEGADTIVIEGQLFNTTAEAQAVPTLEVTLEDEHGRWLADRRFDLGRATLESGETVTFKVIAANPPATMRQFDLAFTEEKPEG